MKRKVLVLDIETAPNLVAVYSLRQRYINPKYIKAAGYVLCFSAQFIGEKDVHYAKSPDGHREMLEKIHALLLRAEAVVHYNGKKFDMPTLNKEFVVHGLAPIPPRVQIDLFVLVKRAFNFPSYKMDYVCKALGIRGKERHMGWSMWEACMDHLHEKHAKAWVVMERYNKGDIRATRALYKKLLPWFEQTFGFKRISEWLDGRRTRP